MDLAAVTCITRSTPRPNARPAVLCSLALVLGLGAGPVRGQAAGELAGLPLEQLLDMTVSGASRLSVRRSEAPAAVTVIGRDEIRVRGWRHLGEVLRAVRGVDVSGDGSYTYAAVRGLRASGDYNTRVLLLIDGHRVNDNLYDQAALGSELPLDLALVERVEFIAGPGSAVYGANALFGVINVVTREPTGDGHAEAAVRAGSLGERALRASLDISVAGGRLLLAGRAGRLDGGSVQESWFGPQAATGTAGMHQHGLYLRWDRGPWRLGLISGLREQGTPASPDTVFGDRRARVIDRYHMADLEHRGALGEDTELTGRVFAGSYAFVGDYPIDYPQVTLNRDVSVGSWWGAEGRLTHRLSEQQRLVLGVDAQRQLRQVQRNFDVEPQPLDYLDDRRQGGRVALFGDHLWQWSDGWSLQSGLRADREQGVGHLSPRLAVRWTPAPGWTLRAQHGGAFREPNAYERWYHGDGPGSWRLNPALHGERIRSDELGLEWGQGAWRLAGAAYQLRARGLTSLRHDAQDDRYQYENLGLMASRGLEAELEFLRGGQRYRLNGSWNQVLEAPAGLSVGYPAGMLNAMGQWRLADGVQLALDLHWRSARGEAPALTLLNLGSQWSPMPGWRLGAGVRNLAGRRVYDPGPDPLRQPLVRGGGRQAWLELVWEDRP
jgi:iron complex outermembrane receptor protein